MRVVVLSSSVYSESACAMAARLAQSGYVPVGALSLRALKAGTLLRKAGQWGWRSSLRYAGNTIFSRHSADARTVRNSYLAPALEHEHGTFRTLRQVGKYYKFPVALCGDQNSPVSIAQLKKWTPDLIVFSGGNILRKTLIEVPRLGVLNAHLGLLPEIRGMNSPEWSLLCSVPPGVTIHYVDTGIDTGPILKRRELPDATRSASLHDLRHRLIAFGIEEVASVVALLDRGTIKPITQSEIESGDRGKDSQYFVMHEWLQARSAEALTSMSECEVAGRMHG